MSALNLGIIGAGLAVQKLHWPALVQLPDLFHVAAVADIHLDRAQQIAALTGAPLATADYHELLANPAIDAILISLPIHLQARVLVETVQAGKHVICEKPPASSAEQSLWLRQQLTQPAVTIVIAENFRYRQDLAVVQAALAAGSIGDLAIIRTLFTYAGGVDDPTSFSSTPWRHDAQYRGGPILDGGVHHIAALRDLGGPVEWVQAFAKYGSTPFGGFNSAAINLRFRSGALGSLIYSAEAYGTPRSFLNLTLHGTAGALTVTDGSVTWLHPDGTSEPLPVPHFDNGYRGEFENLFHAVRDGAPVRATLAESCADLELLMRALDAAEQAAVLPAD